MHNHLWRLGAVRIRKDSGYRQYCAVLGAVQAHGGRGRSFTTNTNRYTGFVCCPNKRWYRRPHYPLRHGFPITSVWGIHYNFVPIMIPPPTPLLAYFTSFAPNDADADADDGELIEEEVIRSSSLVPSDKAAWTRPDKKERAIEPKKRTTATTSTRQDKPDSRNGRTIQAVRAQDKYAGFRKMQMIRRTHRHTQYWKELWGHCADNHPLRSRVETERFLDRIAQRGCRVDALLLAARKIEQQAKVASDYNCSMKKEEEAEDLPKQQEQKAKKAQGGRGSSRKRKRSTHLMGPLTLLISTIRDNTPPSNKEKTMLIDFICNIARKNRGEDESSEDNMSLDDDDHEEEDDSDITMAEPGSREDRMDQELTECLRKVRYQSLFVSPLFWGQPDSSVLQQRREAYRGKTHTERQREAHYLATKLRHRLPSYLYNTTHQLLDNYLNLSKHTSSSSTMTRESTSLHGGHPPQTIAAIENPTSFNVQIRRLNKLLYKATSTHFHWIATDVAQFFGYEDMSSKLHRARNLDDPLVREAQEAWFRKRKKVVEILMDIEERLFRSIMQQRQYIFSVGDSAIDGTDIFLDVKKLREQPRKKHAGDHFFFDSVLLEHGQDRIESTAPPFVVVVENLPIDVTEDELELWYGRCGIIKSISIRNQRLDLDPGSLPKKQQSKGRKAPRRIGERWARPRSPVYGLIEFADEGGYEKATQPALCVFGMILNRHDVRTIPSHTGLRTLYVENLDDQPFFSSSSQQLVAQNPSTLPMAAGEVESRLQTMLDPVWVTIASGQDGRGAVGSFQIEFPSFDISWWAFEKLSAMDEFPHVHWIPSPRDSLKWWTREVSF